MCVGSDGELDHVEGDGAHGDRLFRREEHPGEGVRVLILRFREVRVGLTRSRRRPGSWDRFVDGPFVHVLWQSLHVLHVCGLTSGQFNMVAMGNIQRVDMLAGDRIGCTVARVIWNESDRRQGSDGDVASAGQDGTEDGAMVWNRSGNSWRGLLDWAGRSYSRGARGRLHTGMSPWVTHKGACRWRCHGCGRLSGRDVLQLACFAK